MDSRQHGIKFPAGRCQEQDHRFLSDGLFLQEGPYEGMVPVPCRGFFHVDRVADVDGRSLPALIISWKFRSGMIGCSASMGEMR
jgi:hypothetical protein